MRKRENMLELDEAKSDAFNRRIDVRQTILRRALVFPLREQAAFAVYNMSTLGLRGALAVPLELRQGVHVSFDSHSYFAAEVRWANGDEYGLEMKMPLMFASGASPVEMPSLETEVERPKRFPVEMEATLATSLPVHAAKVRNISSGGAMIEVPGRLREGEPLLLQVGAAPARLSRVQWSRGAFAGIVFSKAIEVGGFLAATRYTGSLND